MDSLADTRREMREMLRQYAMPPPEKSPDELLREEAEFAASDLKSSDLGRRIKAIDFLELLAGNPYAQEYLLDCLESKDSMIVSKTVSALGKVGTPTAIPRLKEAMKKIKAKHVVSEIARVISKLEKIASTGKAD